MPDREHVNAAGHWMWNPPARLSTPEGYMTLADAIEEEALRDDRDLRLSDKRPLAWEKILAQLLSGKTTAYLWVPLHNRLNPLQKVDWSEGGSARMSPGGYPGRYERDPWVKDKWTIEATETATVDALSFVVLARKPRNTGGAPARHVKFLITAFGLLWNDPSKYSASALIPRDQAIRALRQDAIQAYQNDGVAITENTAKPAVDALWDAFDKWSKVGS